MPLKCFFVLFLPVNVKLTPLDHIIRLYLVYMFLLFIGQRDGEYGSHLRGFCHYRRRGVDAGHHSCKTTEYKSTDSPLLPFFKCNVLRESIYVNCQNIPCATLKKRGVVGNLCISLLLAKTEGPCFPLAGKSCKFYGPLLVRHQ
jgi:hypothetical protein